MSGSSGSPGGKQVTQSLQSGLGGVLCAPSLGHSAIVRPKASTGQGRGGACAARTQGMGHSVPECSHPGWAGGDRTGAASLQQNLLYQQL